MKGFTKVHKPLVTTLLIVGLAPTLAACDIGNNPPNTQDATPTQPATQVSQPSAGTTESPVAEATRVYRAAINCSLLNSYDLAHFWVYAEVQHMPSKVSDVDRLIFSSEPISATEVSC